MMSREKMIVKIQNLLDLANNNPNENEAIAAALKAQELMAKYDVQIADVTDPCIDQEIIQEIISFKKNTGYCIKWRFSLAQLISNNFKVKFFTIEKDDVVFYGYKSDVQIAVSVFNFLFNTGNKLSLRYYNACRNAGATNTRGLMNSYLLGFMAGLKDVLEKQCTELMIVIPQEVSDSFEKMSQHFSTFSGNISHSGNTAAYENGKFEGRSVAESRSIDVA